MVPVAIGAIACLGGLEVVCRILAWLRRRHGLGRYAITPASLVPLIGAAAVVSVALLETIVSPVVDPGAATISGGSVLFAIGWALRYPLLDPRPALGEGRWQRFLGWISRLRWQGVLNLRHLRYCGLLLEVGGLVLIAGAPVAALLWAIFPGLLAVAVRAEEELREMRGKPFADDVRNARLMSPNAFLSGQVLIFSAVLSGIVTLSVGFATREIEIFSSSSDSARTLLLAASGAQGTTLLFVLSAVLIGMQFVATSYSWSVTQRSLTRLWPIGAAALFVLISLSVTFVAAAALEDSPAATATTEAIVDLAMLWALIAIVILVASLWTLRRALSVEGLTAAVLDGLNSRWANWVRKQWASDWARQAINDPFIPVPPMLLRLIDQRDAFGFKVAAGQLYEALTRVWPRGDSPISVSGSASLDTWGQPGEEAAGQWPQGDGLREAISVDNYLHRHLRSVVRAAGRSRDPEFLELITDIVQDLYRRGHPYVSGEGHMLWSLREPALGERLAREIALVAVDEGNESPGESAIWVITFAAERLVKGLPALSETRLQYNLNEAWPDRTEEQREQERLNDGKIEVLERGYGEYFSELGRLALHRSELTIVEACLRAIGSIMEEVIKSDHDIRIQRAVLGSLSYSYFELLDEVLASQARIRYLSSPFDESLYRLPDGARGDDLAGSLCEYEVQFIKALREHDRITSYIVHNSARILFETLRRQPARALKLIDELSLLYESSASNEQGAKVRDDLQDLLLRVAKWAHYQSNKEAYIHATRTLEGPIEL